MNYFAHGRRFVDEPLVLAGTAVPDWLNVADRKVRVRSKQAGVWVGDADGELAAVARGIVRHHADDAWFHQTPAFAELSWRFAAMIRDGLPPDDGLRPTFLGHILVEILLDAALIAEQPAQLDAYYAAVDTIDGSLVQSHVNRMAWRDTRRLAWFIGAFARERFLWDYLDDGKLWFRLNQVMRRVGLSQLPESFCDLLPAAREEVAQAKDALLDQSNENPADSTSGRAPRLTRLDSNT